MRAAHFLPLAYLASSAAAACYSAVGVFYAVGKGDFLLSMHVWEGVEGEEANANCYLVLPNDTVLGNEYWLTCKETEKHAALLYKKTDDGLNAVSIAGLDGTVILDLKWEVLGILGLGTSVARSTSC